MNNADDQFGPSAILAMMNQAVLPFLVLAEARQHFKERQVATTTRGGIFQVELPDLGVVTVEECWEPMGHYRRLDSTQTKWVDCTSEQDLLIEVHQPVACSCHACVDTLVKQRLKLVP